MAPADRADGLMAVTRTKLYEEAMGVPAATMDFTINRPADGDPELTFSPDALESITDAMSIWLGTRIVRHIESGKSGPQSLRARLTVTLDGEEPAEFEVAPVIVVDGQHRKRGT